MKKRIYKIITAATLIIFLGTSVSSNKAYADNEYPWFSIGQILAGAVSLIDEIFDTQLEQPPAQNACLTGEPINLATGEERYECVDLFIPGRGMDLEIRHIYRSGINYNGLYGYGWSINYHQRIKRLSDGNVVVFNGLGRSDEYTYVDGINYTPPVGVYETLVKNMPAGDWTLTKAQGTKWHFDVNGNLTSIVDRNNNTISIAYEEVEGSPALFTITGESIYNQNPLERVTVGQDYRIATMTDTIGNVINFNYNADGRLSTIVDHTGRTLTYTYDPVTDDLLSIAKPEVLDFPGENLTKTFEYTNHNLEVFRNEEGEVTLTNYYDAQDRVIQQDLGEGTILYDYDSVANSTIQLDRNSHKTVFAFNETGQLISKKEYTGTTSVPAIDPLPNTKLRATDPAFFETTFTYNSEGMRTSITYPKGNGVVFQYDTAMAGGSGDERAKGNLLRVIQVEDMSAVTDPLTYVATGTDLETVMTYETLFNQIDSLQDPKGNVTSHTYDHELDELDPKYALNGNLILIERPEVEAGIPTTEFTYDAAGQVVQMIDPNGNEVAYTYEPATGYLESIVQDPSGVNAITQFTYDEYGYLDVVTDANTNPTDFDYNALGWISQEKNSLDYITKYAYDRNGNVTMVERQMNEEESEWQTTLFDYSPRNLLETITDPLTRVTTYSYDFNENLKSILDAAGNETNYIYDERNALFTVTDANSPVGVTTYNYDVNGNLENIIDANNQTTVYAYDDFDRLETLTYEDGSVEGYTYDKNGNITEVKTPRLYPQVGIGFIYDELNRVTTKEFPMNSALDVTYGYDLGSRLELADTVDVQNQYLYDTLNRVDTNTQTVNGVDYVLDYGYDKVGNRVQMTTPSGRIISYNFDELNRMIDVFINETRVTHYSYDLLDRRVRKDYLIPQNQLPMSMAQRVQSQTASSQNSAAVLPRILEKYNGVIQRSTYVWDDANQLKDLSHAVVGGSNISRYQYPDYDNVSNRKQIIAPNGTYDYAYNTIYELTEEQLDQVVTHSYDYDNVGNREIADGVTYVPNSLNQYESVGGTTYSYDDNGNLTNDGINTYAYDEENRLEFFVGPQSSAMYTYDAFNRRVSKDVDGIITYFVYDGDEVIAEYNEVGTLNAEYVYGNQLDEVLVMQRGANVYYYYQDGLGSVTEITDGAGDVVESYIYDPYGAVTIFDEVGTEIATSNIENPYMFTGRRLDQESGIYYYRARQYDPLIGRFLQRDPIGYTDHLNLFQYVGNSPINYIDPYGLIRWAQFGRGVLQYVGGASGVITGVVATAGSGGLAAGVGIPLAAVSGYSMGAGLSNIWSSIVEDSSEGTIPGGIGEAIGMWATISTGDSSFTKWGTISDLSMGFIMGRVGPPGSFWDEMMAIIGLSDTINSTLGEISDMLVDESLDNASSLCK